MRDSKDPDIKAIASKLTEEVSLSLAGNVKSSFHPVHVESESSNFDRFDDGRRLNGVVFVFRRNIFVISCIVPAIGRK